MATFQKIILSGSTNGRSVLVAATATPGTTIHTAHATAYDEIWLWATNTTTTDKLVTVEFGSTTSPNDTHIQTVPAQSGPQLLIPGWLLTNSLVLKVFAATANLVIINGYVNRIS